MMTNSNNIEKNGLNMVTFYKSTHKIQVLSLPIGKPPS